MTIGKGAYVGGRIDDPRGRPAGALGIARGRAGEQRGLGRSEKKQETEVEDEQASRQSDLGTESRHYVRNHRLHRPEASRSHPRSRAPPPRISRLRLRRRGGRPRRRRSTSAAARASSRTSRQAIDTQPLDGVYGLGHTRWATHGRPTEENAHPHRDCTGQIVVVHNGIIENYLDLKRELQKRRATNSSPKPTPKSSRTASSTRWQRRRRSQNGGAAGAPARMRGLFALVLLSADDPEKIVAVRNGPPIVVGLGDDEFFVASDMPAILSHTRDVVFLGDEEMAVITRTGVEFTDFAGTPVSKADAARAVGPDHGGEGRLQALHAQGDLRAAARRRAKRCSAACRSTAAACSSRRSSITDATLRERRQGRRSWRAAPRGMPRWSASS